MANGASEPESPDEEDNNDSSSRGGGIDRREAFKRATILGLKGLAVSSLGGAFASSARAQSPDCNNFNPETGGYFKDTDCGTSPFATDITCRAVKDAGTNVRWNDSHCMVAGAPYPEATDGDCGSPEGTQNGGGGHYYHGDASCGAGGPPGENDDDCGQTADASGATVHGDANPGV